MGWTNRVKRTAFAAAFALFAIHASPALTAHSAHAGQDPSPSFRSGSSELVVLPIVVTDKQNRYVSDLARERFVVFDNGRKVPVELFTNEDSPATIGLLVDASSSMRS